MIKYLLIFISIVFYGCGRSHDKETHPSSHTSGKKTNNSNNENIMGCLNKKIGFLWSRQISLVSFAEKVGNASVQCEASLQDIKQYAKRVIQEYGDL